MQIPNDPAAIAAWLAEAVRIELAAVEAKGGSQVYEVQSGEIVQKRSGEVSIYRFIMADTLRVPDDAKGKLKTEINEYAVTIVSQQGNFLFLELNGSDLPPGIHWARLHIDDTALIRALAEKMEEARDNDNFPAPVLLLSVFHPETAATGQGDVGLLDGNGLSPEQRDAVLKACGSSVTYLWGPPGTGKTTTIAHLVAALINKGERILLLSHTNTAVDQALYAAVHQDKEKSRLGPLSSHPSVLRGEIVRIGTVRPGSKLPETVIFDKIVERDGACIQSRIIELEGLRKPIVERRRALGNTLEHWKRLDTLHQNLIDTNAKIQENFRSLAQAELHSEQQRLRVEECRKGLLQAEKAWFRRDTKIAKAKDALSAAETALAAYLEKVENVVASLQKIKQDSFMLAQNYDDQKNFCDRLGTSRQAIESEIARVNEDLEAYENELKEFRAKLADLSCAVLNGSKALFCTLTKNYLGKELDGQEFDAVIVDEISMALPPLIFLAAARAKKRVILVGDFLQLPPVVQSKNNSLLSTDLFDMTGIRQSIGEKREIPVLSKLGTQRRMPPDIAEIARILLYNRYGGLEDHESVASKELSNKFPFFPDERLTIVDTADLMAWCGKQPGTLSRFNLYSATVAVSIAALLASHLEPAEEGKPQPIAIITPYTAQRKLLAKLIVDMGLSRWVASGTVHTFQGNEAEIVLFDAVLDEPYRSARLCNPQDALEVLRDINVAVTRTKERFIFIGSSEWLNKRARAGSGMGQLWGYIKDKAGLLSACELLGDSLPQIIAGVQRPATNAWNAKQDERFVLEPLDEEGFFERFTGDLNSSSKSIFAFAPYFGEFRWPRIQPHFSAALARGVEITFIVPPLHEAQNKSYVREVVRNLRTMGAVVVEASGIHGKDVIIDEGILYTGSMNWSSNRGRFENIHRIQAPSYVRQYLDFVQAKHLRNASMHEDGSPRVCPFCGSPTRIVNQKVQHGPWDKRQAIKVGCTNKNCKGYLRDVDERPPFKNIPVCKVDGKTKYRLVKIRRSEYWKCPKHPKDCPSYKAVPGDGAEQKSTADGQQSFF